MHDERVRSGSGDAAERISRQSHFGPKDGQAPRSRVTAPGPAAALFRAGARGQRRPIRVRAARRAAARRFCGPFVRAAFRAAALRDAADRRRAAVAAWRESAFDDAADRPSRFSAPLTAREREADGLLRRFAARLAYFALCFVLAFALAGGRGSLTPARRAFDSPIAMACLAERAPCLPSRT